MKEMNKNEKERIKELREKIAQLIFEKHAPLAQTWIGYTRRHWKDLYEDERKPYYDTADQVCASVKEAGSGGR